MARNGFPEIWSKGHRNAQGAIFDPVTKGLLTVEHGATGGDEVNRPEAGKNYGWPAITYGVDYSGDKIGIGTAAPGYEQPLFYWDPSIAPSGLAVYEGAMFPEWQGDLLVGALKFELLSRLDRDANGKIGKESRMFEGAFGRIRDVKVAPDGAIWLLTDEDDGRIIRISRARLNEKQAALARRPPQLIASTGQILWKLASCCDSTVYSLQPVPQRFSISLSWFLAEATSPSWI